VNNQYSESELKEEDILTIEAPDEAIEAAACTSADNVKSFTVAMCTGQGECPFSQ
jgi:hypothetical protein